jgi:hypothetical protein
MKRTTLFAIVALVIPVGLAGQDLKLEHFQCYPVRLQEPPPGEIITLFDQFNPNGEDVEVARASRFCNPTRKIHGRNVVGVSEPDHHLTIYATNPSAQPNRVVAIRNQFGRQKLRLRDAVGVAVPTQKFLNGHNFPIGLDHLRCYAASGLEVNDKVGLSDQFILPVTGHRVIEPVAFCNPAKKIHGGLRFGVEHPEAHLTCYSMSRVKFEKSFGIGNQIQREAKFLAGPPDTLCVPTQNIAWESLPDDTPDVGSSIQ